MKSRRSILKVCMLRILKSELVKMYVFDDARKDNYFFFEGGVGVIRTEVEVIVKKLKDDIARERIRVQIN